MDNKQAILLLSGGIDSTTLLAKLSNENYEVVGNF
jgi:7-cyano-7-deazaguanine synthase in queuosine biosynthesis